MFTPPIRAIIFYPIYAKNARLNQLKNTLNRYPKIRKPAIITCSFASVNAAEPQLSLALLMPRVLADDAHYPLPANDLAVAADLFYRSQYFHGFAP
jgi:hypothetical protein